MIYGVHIVTGISILAVISGRPITPYIILYQKYVIINRLLFSSLKVNELTNCKTWYYTIFVSSFISKEIN